MRIIILFNDQFHSLKSIMSEDVTHHHCNKIRRVAEEEKARANHITFRVNGYVGY